MKLRFGEFAVNIEERLLQRGHGVVEVEPKVFDCIALLASEAPRLVSMERLRATLWPGVHVAGGALRRIINEARKALGDTGDAQNIIRTRKGVGYTFLLEVVLETRVASAQRPSTWPFVGRDRELALLRDWLSGGGNGGVCFISGEAGAGKSVLVARLLSSPGPLRSFVGRCDSTFGVPGFWPFREIAAALAEDPSLRSRVRELGADAPGLFQLLPELATKEHPPAKGAAPRAEARLELCKALARLLCTLSNERPLALVVEDVHWADDGTLAALEAIARAVAGTSLRVLATYRPEAVVAGSALGSLIGRVCGRHGALSVHLDALPVEALADLLGEVRFPGLPSRLAPALLGLTGGNALFVHELVRHLLATARPLEAALSPGLGHVIAERVSALPDSTQRLLEQAAVLGDEFSGVALARLSGKSRDDLDVELEPARRHGLLRQSATQLDRFRFGHALVRDALVSALGPHRRQDHHRAALEALRSMPAGSAASGELAIHAFESADHVPAEERRRLCEEAGREAFDALAFDRAVLHLGRALALLDANDSSEHAAALALLYARALWQADLPEEKVDAAFLQAVDRARRANSAGIFAEAAIGYMLGDESTLKIRMASLYPEALDLFDEAWERLVRIAPERPEDLPGHIAYRVAKAQFYLRSGAGDVADRTHAAERALRLTPADLSPIDELWMLGIRAVAGPERRAEIAAELLERVLVPGPDPRHRLEFLFAIMSLAFARGDLASWERAGRECKRLVALLPEPPPTGRLGERMSNYLGVPLVVPTTSAVLRGELANAIGMFMSAAQRAQELGFARSREGDHDGFHILLQIQTYLGQSALLEPLLDSEVQGGRASRGAWFRALLKATFALERGDRAQATASYAQLRETGLHPAVAGRRVLAMPETLVRVSDLCAEIGTAADAAILYQALLPRAHEFIHDGALISWGSCARPLGALSFQLGHYRDAERHFADAVAMNRRFGHRPEHARSELGLAKVLFATSRFSEALALARSASAAARSMDMTPTVAAAEALIAASMPQPASL